jgi:hypothetical protein
MMKPVMRAVGVAVLLLGTACGGESKPAEAKKQDAPAAEEKKAEPEKNKYTLEREAKAQAAKDAVEKKAKLVADLTVLPEKLPKKLDKACEEVGVAMDGFMVKWFPENWPKLKTKQLNDLKESCTSTGSIEAAACQAKALAAAPEELNKAVPDILLACIEKFAKKPAG